MKNEKDFDVNEFLSDGSATVKPRQTEWNLPNEQSEPTQQTENTQTSPLSQPTQPTRATAKNRKSELDEYRRRFMQTPRIEDRKPVFISRLTRDRLDRIVRLLGERGMSVSGFLENLARHHFDIHADDFEQWRRL